MKSLGIIVEHRFQATLGNVEINLHLGPNGMNTYRRRETPPLLMLRVHS